MANDPSQDFDITTVRKLTPLRNNPAIPFEVREQLSTILKLGENINLEPPGLHRDNLIAEFKRQFAEVAPKLAAMGINI